jgi:integrase
VHQIISEVLGQAAADGLIRANPAKAAKPPSAKQAKAPEMHCWTPAQLAAFLGWSAENSQHAALWHVLACTGMRRGEALALRWCDLDLDAGTASVRRSAGVVRTKGEGFTIAEGGTKTDKPRLIDLDAATVAVLRAHRLERGGMALSLVKPAALVFGSIEGKHRHPEHTSRQFKSDLERCRKALGEGAPPECRLHDLRHAHATALLLAKVPVHVVSQRLGHANPTVTLTVYAHVLSGSQRDAADVFASLIGKAGGA